MRTLTLRLTPVRLFLVALLVGGMALAAAVPTIQPVLWVFKAGIGVKGITTVDVLDAGINSKIADVTIATAAAQDGGTATPLCQFGYGPMVSGALAVTFTKAFSSNPQCNCSHVNSTNSTACVLDSTSVPSTTTAKFLVASGSTDVVDWICCGDK